MGVSKWKRSFGLINRPQTPLVGWVKSPCYGNEVIIRKATDRPGRLSLRTSCFSGEMCGTGEAFEWRLVCV